MKSEKRAIRLHRLIILLILACAVVASISLTADSQQQIKEQHTNESLETIDRWRSEFEYSDNSDRARKINVFTALLDYQIQIGNHALQCEIIDSEILVALSHIGDWFFDDYLSKINEITKAADADNAETGQYLSDLSENIDRISESFTSDDEAQSDERLYKAELFTELSSLNAAFIEDDFISHKADATEARIEELTEIKGMIESESIIDDEGVSTLSGMINSFIEAQAAIDETVTSEANEIIYKFDTEFSLQRQWFEEHYSLLIDEITSAEKEDEFDDTTVKSQIEGLELVKQFIEDDGVAGTDYILSKNELIDKLTEEYESELAEITERIREKEEEEAAANRRNAAAAAASSSNNRTAASNNTNRNSSGSSSSAGTGNQSGSANQSSTGSTPAAGNNRYPALSSSCRDLLARLVKLEAPNESADGKQAVAEVVLNRMGSSRWSHANTVEEVVFDTKWGVQFAVKDLIWTDRGTPTSADTAAVDRALGGSNVLSKDYVFFAQRPITQNDVIWIGNHAFSK